jgi:cysteine-rich repeat protein
VHLLLSLLAAGSFGFTPKSFHLNLIKEIYAGSDSSASQYVVLQAYAGGQNQIVGKEIRVYARNGNLTGAFTFQLNVANGADQATILMANTTAGLFFNMATDQLIFSGLGLDPLGGKLCFYDPQFLGDMDCVAWGGYNGNPSGVGTPVNVPVGLQRGLALRRRLDVCGSPTVLEACDDTGNSANDFVFAVPAPVNNAGMSGTVPPSVCGNNLLQSLEQCDDGNVTPGDGCSAQCFREPSAFTPVAIAVDANDNSVLEPGENVDLAPSWRNASTAILPLSGILNLLTGPPGAIYTLSNAVANYGSTVPPGTVVSCGFACYVDAVGVSNPSPRPVTHWDVTVSEVMSSYSFKSWVLHVGNSFSDVPRTNPFYRFIETLLHRGVTGGCTGTTYCPATSTTRDAMAVFVLVSKEGPAYNPPACGTPVFLDVPAANPFCKWIEELARRGVVSGCGGGNYCPSAAVTREQMAVFVLRTLDPALNPPNCGNTPMFPDVPASSPFCKWIEELARRGVVTGCGGGNYCPTAAVSREQMGVFLGVTFNLTLYGVN